MALGLSHVINLKAEFNSPRIKLGIAIFFCLPDLLSVLCLASFHFHNWGKPSHEPVQSLEYTRSSKTPWISVTSVKYVNLNHIPSGYLLHSHGKSPFLSSVNHLFLWAMVSMAMLNHQRVNSSWRNWGTERPYDHPPSPRLNFTVWLLQ